jgi:hypothetical protein
MKQVSALSVTVRAIAISATAVAMSFASLTGALAQGQTGGCTIQGSANTYSIPAGQSTTFATNMLCAAAAGKNESAKLNFTIKGKNTLPTGATVSPNPVPVDAEVQTITIQTAKNSPPGGYTATFSATSPSCPGGYFFNGTPTNSQGNPNYCFVTFAITSTVAVPINFRQKSVGALRNGTLVFEYEFDSSTGKLADLKDCQVGENVLYPSGSSPFVWPKPPYNGSTPTPTIGWVPASHGKLEDQQKPKPFVKPYVANTFTATQSYRYQCPKDSGPVVDFAGETGILITRTVADSTGRGCWGYTVSKSGSSFSVLLPGVTKADCCSTATQPAADIATGGPQFGMTVAPPSAPVGVNEPIFAALTLDNPTAEEITVDLGLNGASNLALTISTPIGEVITQALDQGSVGLPGKVSLAPGGTFVEKLLPNEWYNFPVTGTTQIKLTLDDAAAATGVVGVNQPSTEFSVHVAPYDPASVTRLAQRLADTAIGGPTLEDKMEAAKTLSYVLDPLAVSSLVRVLQQSPIVAHYAVDGLGRIRNPEAIDALTAARDYLNEEIRTAVRYTLAMIQGQAPRPSAP